MNGRVMCWSTGRPTGSAGGNSVICTRVCESVCICVGVCAYRWSVIKVKNYEPAKNSDSCYTKQKKSLKRTEGSVRARH